jgi:uncharacterized protein (DUF2345 family)
MQAQAGQAQVAAKGLVNIQTANAHIDWAAAKKITLSTSGGATIELSGSGIEVKCPGKITVKAATKAFAGNATESYSYDPLPSSELPQNFDQSFVFVDAAAGTAISDLPYRVKRSSSGLEVEGQSSRDGATRLVGTGTSSEELQVYYTGDEDKNHGW